MKISVIIPTARPWRVQTIVDYMRRWSKNELDVVVSSPGFDIDGAKNIKDDMVGSSRAIADAFAHTDPNSSYVCWLSDICLPVNDAVDYMASFLGKIPVPCIAEFRTSTYDENHTYRVCTITGNQYARWGMLSRRSIELIGGFFDPQFACFFGDVDMSLRCWKVGGRVLTCENALISMDGQRDAVTTGNWEKSRASDRENFIARWWRDYPVMREQDDSVWNVDRVLARTS